MPLIKIKQFNDDGQLGLWQITEDIKDLHCPDFLNLSDIHSVMRQKERLVAYALLEAMTGLKNTVIRHNDSGKPFIDNYEISLSHTRGWAAMILAKRCRVGVDIEYYSDRVYRIADRFIRPDEERDGLEKCLINWCAKEALFKMRSEEDLRYFDMRLHPFKLSNKCVEVDDLKQGDAVRMNFEYNHDYILTWCASSPNFSFCSK